MSQPGTGEVAFQPGTGEAGVEDRYSGPAGVPRVVNISNGPVSLSGRVRIFANDPSDEVEVALPMTDSVNVNEPELKALIELSRKGIHSAADIDTFMDLIISLSHKIGRIMGGENDVDPDGDFYEAYRTLRFKIGSVADILAAFKELRIPFSVSDSIQTSFTARSPTEWRNRDMPAGEHGITLARGTTFYTLLHEIAHALPSSKIMSVIDRKFYDEGEDEEEETENVNRWELAYPAFPGDDASLAETFIGIAGRMFRDELYAALAEICLADLFGTIGAPVPAQIRNNRRFVMDEDLKEFARQGAYLGDNHLILYDLIAAAEAAERIKEDPGKAIGDVFDSSHGVLSMAAYDTDRGAWKRRLNVVTAEIKRELAAIYQDSESRHPLKPALMRLNKYISAFLGIELSRSLHARTVGEHIVGARPFTRPEGRSDWVTNRMEAAKEVAGILTDFSEIGMGKLARLVRHYEYEALGSLAMMVPDGDLPKFWSMVLTRVDETLAVQQGASEEKVGDMYPLVLSFVLQGYFDEAKRLLPIVQGDSQLATQWTIALFNGIDAVSRMGDRRSVALWAGILDGEARMNWTMRYRLDILSAVKEYGKLTSEGEKRLNGFLDARASDFIPSRAVFDLMYELTDEGLYEPSVLNMSDIEDSFDLQKEWYGSRRILDAESFFESAFPDFSALAQLSGAARRLKERGFTEEAARLSATGELLIRSLISFRSDTVTEKVMRGYQERSAKFRGSDSFHAHAVKLGVSETEYLPTASALAGELMVVIGLSAEMGGGWKVALEYLRRLPDGFVKTFAAMRLSREMGHLPAPDEENIVEFMNIWSGSLESSLKEIPQGSAVQPDDEGIIFRDFNDEWLSSYSADRHVSTRRDAASCAYSQKQIYEMLSAIPAGAGGELSRLRSRLQKQLAFDGAQDVFFSPQFVLPMYDPAQDVEQVIFKQSRRTKQVYHIVHDPNIIAFKVAIESAPAVPDAAWFKGMRERIEDALRTVPPAVKAPYISLLITLSAMAERADEPALADELYEGARQLGEMLRVVSEDMLGRLYKYDGLNDAQRAFDVQARYRRFQATWERTALLSFARIIAEGSQNADHYASEIARIIDNESIFDIMESADYREAALLLDRAGRSDLVYELFRRAVETRQREQFEASYDVEHELTTAIDRSGLSPEEKDELLERLSNVSLQRVFRSSTMRLARSHTRERFILEMGRLFEPVAELLDLVSSRGYTATENTIWKGLRKLLDAALGEIPDPLHPMVMSRPALLALVMHPEIVHPASGPVPALFDSPFAGGDGHDYADLPPIWKIKEAYANEKEGQITKNFTRIISEVPKDSDAVDPYLLGLLNVDFTASLIYDSGSYVDRDDGMGLEDSRPSSAQVNVSSLPHVKKIMSHFGFRNFEKFARARPDIVRSVFLSHLGRGSARLLARSLAQMLVDKDMPADARLDAFRALERTGYVSDYLRARFESSLNSDEGIRMFLDAASHIFDEAARSKVAVSERSMHPPDWLIAPLFEDVISREAPVASQAAVTGSLVDGEINVRGGIYLKDITPYSVLNTVWREPGDWRIHEYGNDENYFLTRLREAADDINDAIYERFKEGSQDIDDTLLMYRRNNTLVRMHSVAMPEAFERLGPVLRFVIADYISLVAPSTRTLLLSALFRSQEKLGEDEVLSIFFELTGQEKLAQFLSLQEGIVPESYRKKLSKFQEDLKPSTHQEIVDTLRRNGIYAGTDIKNGDRLAFEHAGTVGELWSSELMDGRRIAIKILPWKKRRRNEESIRTLERLSSDMQLFQKELFGGINIDDLYARYRETLLDEMDYRQEAANLGKLRGSMDEAGITYPVIHEDMLKRDVMAMDYIKFKNMAEVGGEEGRRIVDVTGSWLARSIFRDGVYYEDFHPGNIKLKPGKDGAPGRPLVLDFGRIGELTAPQRQALMQFLVSVKFEDLKGVVDGLISMAKAGSRVNRRTLTTEVANILENGAGALASSKIQSLFSAAARRGADLEPNYLQFIKAVISWENVMRTVDTEVDFSTYAGPVILEELSRGPEGRGNIPPPVTQGPAGPAVPPPIMPSPGMGMSTMGLGMFARMPMPMAAPMPLAFMP